MTSKVYTSEISQESALDFASFLEVARRRHRALCTALLEAQRLEDERREAKRKFLEDQHLTRVNQRRERREAKRKLKIQEAEVQLDSFKTKKRELADKKDSIAQRKSDITEQKRQLVFQLKQVPSQPCTLQDLIPILAYCQKSRRSRHGHQERQAKEIRRCSFNRNRQGGPD